MLRELGSIKQLKAYETLLPIILFLILMELGTVYKEININSKITHFIPHQIEQLKQQYSMN